MAASASSRSHSRPSTSSAESPTTSTSRPPRSTPSSRRRSGIVVSQGAPVGADHGCGDRPDRRARRGGLMAQNNEKPFETEICEHLAAHGWLYSTERRGLRQGAGAVPRGRLRLAGGHPAGRVGEGRQAGRSPDEAKQRDAVARPAREGARHARWSHGGGTLNVLRKGFKQVVGAVRRCAQFKPATTLNPATLERYGKVRRAGDAAGVLLDRTTSAVDRPGAVRQRPAGRDARVEDRLHPVGRGRHRAVQEVPPAQGPRHRSRASRCWRSGRGRWCTSRCRTTRSG